MVSKSVTLSITPKGSFASLDYLFCFTFNLADLLQAVVSGDELEYFFLKYSSWTEEHKPWLHMMSRNNT